MSEPVGLNMSLDDIIKKNSEKHSRGRGDRGRGGNLAARGGIQKRQTTQHQGGFQSRGGQTGGRFGFGGRRGGGRFGGDRFGNDRNEGFRGQGFQQHNNRGQGFKGPAQRGGFRGGRTGGQQLFRGNQQTGFSGRAIQQDAQPDLQCFVRQDTGEVVVQLKATEIVVVAPNGEITLDDGGWFTQSTLNGMNEALNLVGLRVVASDEISSGDWKISDGHSLIRYYTGIKLPAKGVFTGRRGQIIYAAFQDPHAKAMALAACAASTAAAVAGMTTGAVPGMSMGLMRGAGMGSAALQGQMSSFGAGMGSSSYGLGGAGEFVKSVGLAGNSAFNMGGQVFGQAAMSADMMRRLKAQGRMM